MNIPKEAVEAAARMSQALHFAEPWESLSGFLRSERLREAELILDAAAPYLLRSAWDEAYGKGFEAARGEPDTANPYGEAL